MHGLAIATGWALFFWGWQRVLATGPDFAELRLLMLGAAIVVPAITVSWILHNRGIHRRKGPRRSVPEAVLDYGRDFHGREVIADFRALAHAQRVDIVIEGAAKRYRERSEGAPGAQRQHPDAADGARGAAGPGVATPATDVAPADAASAATAPDATMGGHSPSPS